LGKRTLVRRRGRGGNQFRAVKIGRIAPARYPNFRRDEHHTAIVMDILHERGRDAPLAKIRFDNGTFSYIPATEGTPVGGKLIKSAGSSALVFAHSADGVTIKFPSGKFLMLNPKCRAMIGVIAGGGRKEKPFLKAGNRHKYMRAHRKLYPTVRGIAQAAVYHPHGGGRHQHIGHPSSVSRTTPPGAKVGNIAPRKTGRGRVKERH